MAATAVMTRANARKNICSKNFFVRIKSMLNLDFYRLFHTPAFYIMLCIAAFVPAMVLSITGHDTVGPNGEIISAASAPYTNVWQVLAPLTPTYVVADMGEYANINMVYIFSGILSSIFIGHDYMSGFVKNVFTVHSKKFDYVISKIYNNKTKKYILSYPINQKNRSYLIDRIRVSYNCIISGRNMHTFTM